MAEPVTPHVASVLRLLRQQLRQDRDERADCSTYHGGARTDLGIQPEAYDPKLDVDFAPLREADPAAAGFGQAA
ncbi:hypothetical protein [Streptomyces sp. NPDC059378]|uniref:hypothetical protein n=1 Tax=Streptomyces sp. NPDC059378 TaxID=3346815 RepID=UPI0036A15EB2